MKFKFIALSVLSVLFLSCSSDDSDPSDKAGSINGEWHAHEIKINNATATDYDKLTQDMFAMMTKGDCNVLSLNFKEDKNFIIESSLEYVEIITDEDGTWMDIPCPVQKDRMTKAYSYSNGKLSYEDDNGKTMIIDIVIAGDLMTLNASDLGVLSPDSEGRLIFKRK